MNYDQLAQQAQAEGNAAQAKSTSQADTYRNDYTNYQNQANAANQNIQDQNAYMKGAGSATNLYNTALDAQSVKTGYNQGAMQSAQNNLAQAQGSMSAFNDFANTGASKWGLNAGGLAAANAGATAGLNNNIASSGNALGIQQKAYEMAQTGANQEAGLNVQQQQVQLAGYKNAFDAATKQQDTAASQMDYFSNLAAQQGVWTTQNVQGYQAAKELDARAKLNAASAAAAYAQAQAAIAQAGLYGSQAAGQNISNNQATAYGNSQAYQNYLKTGSTSGAAPSSTSAPQSNTESQPWYNSTDKGFSGLSNHDVGAWFGDVAHNLHLFGA